MAQPNSINLQPLFPGIRIIFHRVSSNSKMVLEWLQYNLLVKLKPRILTTKISNISDSTWVQNTSFQSILPSCPVRSIKSSQLAYGLKMWYQSVSPELCYIRVWQQNPVWICLLPHTCHMPTHIICFDMISLIIFGDPYKSQNCSAYSFLQPHPLYQSCNI